MNCSWPPIRPQRYGPDGGQRRPDPLAGQQPSTVIFYTAPDRLQAPAGGELQLLKTAQYLRQLGVSVRLFDPWRHRLDQADWVHLFGMSPECSTMARIARRCGTRVALSPVAWYDPRAQWHLEPTWPRRLRALAGWSARRAVPAVPTWRRHLVHAADLVLPNSQAEAEQLQRLFALPLERIRVVPNGVDPRFERADPEPFVQRYGLNRFVLVPGRIEPRKNQLAVVRALWGAGLDLVLLGDPHPDHLDYYRQCRREADAGVRFIGRLGHDSPLLAGAYAAAAVVVLASWFETPGLAALEAALAGAAVVVTERGCAAEYFGPLARYVRPDRLGQIRRQVRRAFVSGPDPELRRHVHRHFLWSQVARHTLLAYQCVAPAGAAAGPRRLPAAA